MVFEYKINNKEKMELYLKLASLILNDTSFYNLDKCTTFLYNTYSKKDKVRELLSQIVSMKNILIEIL